ncbi:DUF2164 domain-containing protein [Paenibacillus sp. FJAT-26967]|uniref:DUF2164 domain-containing protein n=1 Tax=Paenibacillus sp. FJAT-26967 TaxID=1729690 RepID=UPI0008392F53|nr:DUF2164 domain-containing protein [Paenibacillus sp. FJAT-26967]
MSTFRPSRLPTEIKQQMKSDIQFFFEKERGETIGDLAADGVLEFVISKLSPHFYNEGIKDARATMMERMASLEEDLYALEKPLPSAARQ